MTAPGGRPYVAYNAFARFWRDKMLMLPVIFLGWVLAIAGPAVCLFGCVKLLGLRLASHA